MESGSEGVEPAERFRPQVRTFHPRRGRMTPRQRRAFEAGSRTVADFVSADAADPRKAFDAAIGGIALEIGFGMGDATLAMAEADPSTGIIAVDVHTPGSGALLAGIGERGLANVIVLDGDALELLPELPDAALDEVRVYFPDPWPKRRHAKRRLVSESFAATCARVLSDGGVLHIATDWEPYAEWSAQVLADSPEFPEVAVGDEPVLRRGRPETRYERTGVREGRPITEVVAVRARRPG